MVTVQLLGESTGFQGKGALKGFQTLLQPGDTLLLSSLQWPTGLVPVGYVWLASARQNYYDRIHTS